MRLCARGSVKAVQQRSFMLWGKSRPIPVVNWLVSPGGTRHCIAKSVRYSISQRVLVMDRAYEEYFESLDEGEEALSFAEFVEALS